MSRAGTEAAARPWPGPGEYLAKRTLDTPQTMHACGRAAGASDPAALPRGERGVWGNAPQ